LNFNFKRKRVRRCVLYLSAPRRSCTGVCSSACLSVSHFT